MVQFDDLRISDDKQKALVECHIKDYAAYANMYIKSIKIEYYKKRGVPGVPGEAAITMYENTLDDATVKQVATYITLASLDKDTFGTDKFEGGLFYVTVECDGTLGASAALLDCGEDSKIDIGLIADWGVLYSRGMKFITSMVNNCNPCVVPDNLEHFIILWNGFKLAATACDYPLVDKLWSRIVYGDGTVSGGSGCGCK